MSPRKPVPPAKVVTRLRTNLKLFVLDSNVLMHDPTSLFRFQEHDVYIPMVTLEELDNNKRGMSEVARNARARPAVFWTKSSAAWSPILTTAFLWNRTAAGMQPADCSSRLRRLTTDCPRDWRVAKQITRS